MSFVLFVILNTIFGCLDIFGVPTMLQRFKIQKNINVPVSSEMFNVLVNLGAQMNDMLLQSSDVRIVKFCQYRFMSV